MMQIRIPIPFDPTPGSSIEIAAQMVVWEAGFNCWAYFNGPPKNTLRLAVRAALREWCK
jgi:hypothetical protein